MMLQQVLRFGGVGSIGFAVDGGILWSLISAGMDPYFARFISFPIAVIVTWWLNRSWTFAQADRMRPAAQFNRYLTVQIAGALSNYLVYASYIALFDPTITNAMIGLILGSVLGMFINFFGARSLVFRA